MTAVGDRALIGMPVNRVEGPEKVTGRARYTADGDLPELVYAVLVQSEIPRGAVTAESMRVCAERAAAAPGVLHVLTPLNRPSLNPPPADLSDDLPLERRLPLADLTVEHVGQHVALVVADTAENAADAAALFDLEYHRREPVRSAAEVSPARPADEQGAVRHGSYRPDHFVKLVDEKLQDQRGQRAEPQSAVRVGARYTTPVNSHYPIELSATIASWDGDTLTVDDSTRWITGERRVLATCLGLPEDSVRVRAPLVGGAFGSKSFLWMHVLLCAVAARTVGRPVKLVLTRQQMFTSTGHRPRTSQEVTLLADGSGVIASSAHHTVTETSTVAHFCEPVGLSTRFLYHSPRLDVTHEVARINSATPCFMRGPGEAPGLFALEVAMDELADATGVDPLDLRIRNHADHHQPSGKPWSGKHLLDCYREAAERFGWAGRAPEPRSLRRGGVLVGWGMATATYPGRRMPAACRVETADDGTVRFASATHEIGNGVRTVMTQLISDITGLPRSAVTFSSGDSAFPDAPYSGASQTTATVGSAVAAAAHEWVRRRGLAESLSFEVTVKPDSAEEAVSQSFGAHFCEVEVDEQIGRATVSRWVATFDCGRVLNPKLARSQIMGGVMFGLGMALLEQVPFDPSTGQLIGEYYVPTHADRPEFDITFIDTPDYGLSPLGARGIGEIGACGVPAAIANGIHHATGRRLRDLPITLEDLMTPFPSQARP